MQGLEPEDICKRLKISRERYGLIVAETAIEMRNFGLRARGLAGGRGGGGGLEQVAVRAGAGKFQD